MTVFTASQMKGQIHFGIITIRQDEFEAVLQRFPSEDQVQSADRLYSLSQFRVKDNQYMVAIVRCPEQGTGEAQNVARDLIEDLSPSWLVVAGIAGGVPSDDFSLGDVIVGTQIVDFSREAIKQGLLPELDLSGGVTHQSIRGKIAQLPALKSELGNWNSESAIAVKLPTVDLSQEKFYGPVAWKKKAESSLKKRFSTSRQPIVFAGPIASSDRLIKSTTLPGLLLKAARSICCVEMEAAGVYRAAQRAERQYPVLVVRGLSDVIGFKRDNDWTMYACHSAASFTHAFLRYIAPMVELIIQPQAPVKPVKKNEPVLRLEQQELGKNKYRINIELTDTDGSRMEAEARFKYELTDADRADLRWYLEDYLQYPLDPAPQIASRIEARMKELGTKLFKEVFKSNDALNRWFSVKDHLGDVRVEISTEVKGATAIPWELMWNPESNVPVALQTKSFTRSYSRAVKKPYIPQDLDKIRILIVICRPSRDKDVPFRSVAGRLIKSLSDEARAMFQLDVLRPPTFAQLDKVLRNAKAKGEPYHIVHFDGHGGYLDYNKDKVPDFLKSLIPLMLSGPRDGSHGFLFFENPTPDKNEENIQLVDGLTLGELLVETDVPILVLNACRSAHSEIQEQPKARKGKEEDVHSQVHAFGSLAQEVMDAGVAGVVAMRYNVYVVTAAQFVADLYAALASGQGLGEAVSMGRKQLAAQPLREIAFDPIALQDWSVPVAYEAAPIQLFQKVGATRESPLRIDLSKNTRAEDSLPRPDVGFFGRDETILALDRAFDTQSVVLLNAYAGSGKTMTAAEFARWYAQTGGLNVRVGAQHAAPLRAPILFTSFEQYKPMAQVLSSVEEAYRPILEANNIQWLALSDEDRLNLTLQIFQQIPPLWIWDNVEPVNGFPAGTTSAWSEKEQRELKMFLQIVTAQSKTKFLLTSRRDEREWLGDIPKRVTLPPMPMQERVRLTRALADKHGKRIADVKDWLPLLRFTQGNPLTITVMVGQALRDGISSAEQIETYLDKLHNGETAFDDEASEGRSKSLGASLSYGFEQAFSADERKFLALLHFFQGFVDVDVIRWMVNPENSDWGLGMKDFTDETGIAILDKAADIGLLTAHGGGYYTIHPALPWFFRSLFERCYPQTVDGGPLTESPSTVLGPPSMRATRAYVESMGELGNHYFWQYEGGNRDVIALLRREEPNLLHARSVARQHAWWDALINVMQGLRKLYNHTGRRAEWKRLVEEIVPDFVGADDLPLSGREEQWSIVTQHRVRLAQESRNLAEAERLQRMWVEWERHRAKLLLSHPVESLSAEEKNTLRTLAASLHNLGEIQRAMGQSDCVSAYQEAVDIMYRIGDHAAEAEVCINIGNSYKDLFILRNLDEAERWYRRSLELRTKGDRLGHAKCYSQLGSVEYEKFIESRQSKQPDENLLTHLNAAVNWYNLALENNPPDRFEGLAIYNNQLGNIYADAGDLERALYHYNQDVHYDELAGNQYGAGQTRFNVALTLAKNGRLSDALLYARAALRNFETYGGRAKDDEDRTKGLIAKIEERLNHD